LVLGKSRHFRHFTLHFVCTLLGIGGVLQIFASLALRLQVGNLAMDILRSVQQQKHCDGNYLPKVVVVVVHTKNFDVAGKI
jgi:hypothetical protein